MTIHKDTFTNRCIPFWILFICSFERNIDITTFERIKFLAEKQKKNLKTVAIDLGFGENAIYKWKNQSPTTENLTKVADYFGVTLDYLVGREGKTYMHESSKDLDEILDNAMSFDGKPLTEIDKDAIRAFMQGRLSSK